MPPERLGKGTTRVSSSTTTTISASSHSLVLTQASPFMGSSILLGKEHGSWEPGRSGSGIWLCSHKQANNGWSSHRLSEQDEILPLGSLTNDSSVNGNHLNHVVQCPGL